VNGRLDRKAFVTTLGAAGLGLGMTAATGGARSALAHGRTPPDGSSWEPGAGPLDEIWKLHAEFYKGFTESLADQLRGTNADEVDAAIRKALMSVIDSGKDDGRLTYGQAEALKVFIATTDAPLGPGPIGMALFGFHGGWAGGHDGMMGHGMPMGGMPACGGGMERSGMQPGAEGEQTGGMPPSEGEEVTGGVQPEQEGSQPSRKHDREARRDRYP
jgi:hypothetical protein